MRRKRRKRRTASIATCQQQTEEEDEESKTRIMHKPMFQLSSFSLSDIGRPMHSLVQPKRLPN